tara:strand:+ start:2351 stop:2605 length:255 start_codon:yes stop_codon:yes gene_type:complete
MILAFLAQETIMYQGVSDMFDVIKLDKNIKCENICNSIQKNLLEKLKKENIPIEGKLLYIEIREVTSTIDPENLKDPQLLLDFS